MSAHSSPWYAVNHDGEHPNSEFLRLSTTIPFHIKTAALMCMQIPTGMHLQKEMKKLVQRVVHLMAKLIEQPDMDSATTTIHLMSTLYSVPTINVHKVAAVLHSWPAHAIAPLRPHHHTMTHMDECNKTLQQCRESVQSAWERMRELVGYNHFAAHQQHMIAHSPTYDHQLVEKVQEVWDEATEAAQHTSSDEHSLPKEFKKNRLRHLPYVVLAALGLGALGVTKKEDILDKVNKARNNSVYHEIHPDDFLTVDGLISANALATGETFTDKTVDTPTAPLATRQHHRVHSAPPTTGKLQGRHHTHHISSR